MKKVNLYIAFILILICFSCSSTKRMSLNEIMDTWLGSTKISLIESWGPPTSTYKYGNSNEILTYETVWQVKGKSYYDQYGRLQYNAPVNRSCKKMIYVNQKGIIYKWKYEGYCR